MFRETPVFLDLKVKLDPRESLWVTQFCLDHICLYLLCNQSKEKTYLHILNFSRALLVLKVPLALLVKKEREVLEESLELLDPMDLQEREYANRMHNNMGRKWCDEVLVAVYYT